MRSWIEAETINAKATEVRGATEVRKLATPFDYDESKA
jgi:hypothetical protein